MLRTRNSFYGQVCVCDSQLLLKRRGTLRRKEKAPTSHTKSLWKPDLNKNCSLSLWLFSLRNLEVQPLYTHSARANEIENFYNKKKNDQLISGERALREKAQGWWKLWKLTKAVFTWTSLPASFWGERVLCAWQYWPVMAASHTPLSAALCLRKARTKPLGPQGKALRTGEQGGLSRRYKGNGIV